MQDSGIPAKFPIPWANGAGGGFVRAIPTASQIGVQNGAASLTDGFPPNCFIPIASGGSWPWAQDMNGIFKQLSAWDQWVQAGAPIGYDATFSTAIGGYPKGAILPAATAGLGWEWISLADNNTTDPDTGGAGWLARPSLAYPAGPGTVITANTTFTGANAGNTYSVVGPVLLSLTTAAFATGQTIGFVCVGTGTSTIQTSGSALIVGAGVSATSLRTPIGSLVTLQFDGTNFRILSAYRLNQNQPAVATNSVLVAPGASGTATASLFVPIGGGIITASASRNVSFSDTVGHLTNLVLNGTIVATDTTETSMTHFGSMTTAGGVSIAANYSSSVSTPSCSLNVMITFTPFT